MCTSQWRNLDGNDGSGICMAYHSYQLAFWVENLTFFSRMNNDMRCNRTSKELVIGRTLRE